MRRAPAPRMFSSCSAYVSVNTAHEEPLEYPGSTLNTAASRLTAGQKSSDVLEVNATGIQN